MTDALIALTSGQSAIAEVLGRRPITTKEVVQIDHSDDDFVCGDIMVTADGVMKRKVRRQRPKRREVEEEADVGAEVEVCSQYPTAEMGIHGRGVNRRKASEAVDTTASLGTVQKDFAHALLIMPPIDVWGPIQALRRAHDPSYERWMPHINMVWPFTKHNHPACKRALEEQLAHIAPFEICLNELGTFGKRKGDVIFLQPTTRDGGEIPQLKELRELMIARFPDLASEEPFLPHLTVGKLEAAKFASLLEEVNWQPLSFIVSEVYIASRPDATTAFTIQEAVPLGSAL